MTEHAGTDGASVQGPLAPDVGLRPDEQQVKQRSGNCLQPFPANGAHHAPESDPNGSDTSVHYETGGRGS